MAVFADRLRQGDAFSLRARLTLGTDRRANDPSINRDTIPPSFAVASHGDPEKGRRSPRLAADAWTSSSEAATKACAASRSADDAMDQVLMDAGAPSPSAPEGVRDRPGGEAGDDLQVRRVASSTVAAVAQARATSLGSARTARSFRWGSDASARARKRRRPDARTGRTRGIVAFHDPAGFAIRETRVPIHRRDASAIGPDEVSG